MGEIKMAGIFKAYDIRGVYPVELDENMTREIGKAFGTLKQGRIAVAADVRLSSPSLKKAFIEGLLSTGATVVDCGEMATPMMIFTTAYYGFDSGIIITASHNPPEYNGVKMFDKGGVPVSYESGISKIEEFVKNKNYRQGSGKIEEKNINQDYVSFVLKYVKNAPKLKIVVDALNGAYSKIGPEVLRKLGMDVVETRCAFNGDFPKEGPDPSRPENLKLLQEKVLQEKADLGIAFDGDGDRLAIVDGNGSAVESRVLFGLLVNNAAIDHPGLKVVHDCLTSDMVIDAIKNNGGIPVVCRVGHTYITQKFLEENASVAGELSGHYFFKETAGGDDALFAAVKVLEYLGRTGKKLDQLVSEFPVFWQGSRRELIKPEAKWTFVEELKSEMSNKYKVDMLDGVKIFNDDGWAVFRTSNTEPKIVIAWEARTQESFKRLEKFVEEIVSRIPK